MTASDGAIRCLPTLGNVAHGISTGYFADAGCSIPVAVTTRDCSPPSYILATIFNCSAFRMELYERGSEVTAVYSKTGVGSSCVASTLASLRYYLIGPEIPPSSFQSATPAIE